MKKNELIEILKQIEGDIEVNFLVNTADINEEWDSQYMTEAKVYIKEIVIDEKNDFFSDDIDYWRETLQDKGFSDKEIEKRQEDIVREDRIIIAIDN